MALLMGLWLAVNDRYANEITLKIDVKYYVIKLIDFLAVNSTKEYI
jgi:hypothetical protein